MLFALILACSGASNPGVPPEPEPVAMPSTNEHAHHMEKMAATRDDLRAKLGDAYDAPVPGLDAADLAKGKATYDATCASCHGPAGKGDGAAGAELHPPPADFTDGFHARYYSDAGRVDIIKNGAPTTAMPGFSGTLDDAAILDVYAYIRSLRPAAP